MTDAADALRQIQRKLIDAPENKFIEVVRVLEQAGDRPEVRRTIESIRPRLTQVRPARRMTLKRLFCDPFEDMLEARAGRDGAAVAIPRVHIDAVWRETAARADPRHMEPLEQAVGGLDSNDADGRHTLGCRLWYACAQALGKLTAEAPASMGAEALATARDIQQYVEIGHQIATLKNSLPPRPIPALEPAHIRLIEAAVQEAARLAPGKPYYLLLTVASRMRRPADLLAALQDMDFGKAKREKPMIFGKLAGVMVDALEGAGVQLGAEDGGAETADPVAAVALAERLVESLDAAQSLLSGVGDLQYEGRLKKVRQAVQAMVRRDVLDPARSQIVVALPPPPAAGGGPLAPPDDAAQETAEARACALRRCERFAGGLALAPDVAATLAEISRNVEKDVARWCAALEKRRNGASEDGGQDIPAEDLETATLSLSYAVRLMELVAGSSRAEALFTGGMAALSAD
jgi:hypothetical protein